MEMYMSFTQNDWGECEDCGDQMDTDDDGYYEAYECPDCMKALCDACAATHECIAELDLDEL